MRLSNWLYQFSCRLTHTGHNSRRRGRAAGDGRRTRAGRRSQQPRTAELLELRILPAVLVNTGASADELIFTLPDGAQAVLEAGAAGQTQLRSTNAAFDTTTFANPATSLTINYGGVLTTETLDVAGVDSGFDAALLIVNGGLNDEFTVSADTDTGSGAVTIDVADAVIDAQLTTTSTIGITASSTVTVNAAVSAGTSGTSLAGDVSIAGAVTVSSTGSLSAGNSRLTIIASNVSNASANLAGTISAFDGITVQAAGDVIVSGIVTTLGSNGDIFIDADLDANVASDGIGGVRVTASGQLNSADRINIAGSALIGSGDPVAVEIEDDGANLQVVSVNTTQINPQQSSANPDVLINGAIQGSSTRGNVFIFALGHIIVGANGDISAPAGMPGLSFIVLEAGSAGSSGGTAVGGISMADGALLSNAGGDIDLVANRDITLGGISAGRRADIRTSGGAILDGGDAHTDIVATDLTVLISGTGIGTIANPLETTIDSLAATTESGDIAVADTDDLTISTLFQAEPTVELDGVSITDPLDSDAGGAISVSAGGALTVAGNVTNSDGGDITLTAGDTAATGDDITFQDVIIDTFNTGAPSITSNGGSITFNVADDVVNTSVPTVTTEGDVVINLDAGSADAGTGSTAILQGTFTVGSLTVNGGDDADTVNAIAIQDSAGADVPVTLNGNGGNDLLTGGNARDLLNGGTGNDTINGAGGGDTITATGGDGTDTVNGNSGNDILRVTNPASSGSGNITFNGGTGSDAIELLGGSADDVTHNFVSNSDGSIVATAGANTHIVTYTGLEPILDTVAAANRTFTFNGGVETIDLTDDGTAGNDRSRIDSTLAEVVTFVNPTSTLTINAGTGSDTINLAGLDSLFDASLTVQGGDGTDAVNVTGDLSTTSSDIDIGTASADIESITFNNGSFTTTGDVLLTASGAVADTDAGTDVTAGSLLADSGTGVGASSARLETSVDALEADGGTGGVFIDNGGDLNIGGVSAGSSGITAGTDIQVRVAGVLEQDEAVTTTGGSILMSATEDILSFDDVTTSGGSVTFNSDSDQTTTPGGGTVVLETVSTSGGDIIIGGGADPLTTPTIATFVTLEDGVFIGGELTSSGGDISIRGSSDLDEDGVDFGGASLSSESGIITIAGTETGGDDAVDLQSSSITSTTGMITITGNATGTNSEDGIRLNDMVISTQTGSITITGNGNIDDGVDIDGGSTIESTGTGAGAVTIVGTSTDDKGVTISEQVSITSVDADIELDGTGPFGVVLFEVTISSGDGDVSITGTGGTEQGVILDDATISTTVASGTTGNISITGSSDGDSGIATFLTTTGAVISGVGGDISLTGTTTSTDAAFFGIRLGESAVVSATGTGSISLVGTGDLTIRDKARVTGSSGGITINAPSSGAGDTVEIQNGSRVSGGDGDVEIIANGTVTLTGVSSNANVTVVSTIDEVIDAGDTRTDIIANALSITAPNGIGVSGLLGSDPVLEINVRSLTTDTSGNNADQALNEAGSVSAVNMNAGTGSIVLLAGAAVQDSDADTDVTADSLTLLTGGAVGVSSSPIVTSINTLSANAGSVDVSNISDLTIGSAGGTDGVTTTTSTSIIAAGALQVSEDIVAGTRVILRSVDAAGSGQNVIIDGVNVTASGGDIITRSGDDTVIDSGATLTASGAVIINVDAGNADPGTGSTFALSGTFVTGNGVTVNGNSDADSLSAAGTSQAVTLNGAGGTDELVGSAAGDSISGGSGADAITGGQGSDTLTGGDGGDEFLWNNGDGSDTVDGGNGDDRQTINAASLTSEGDRFILRDNGVRVLVSRAGGTSIGAFTIDAGTVELFVVNLLAGNDTLDASGMSQALLSVSGGEGNDSLTGSEQGDTLSGGSDNDTIQGGSGDDVLDGGLGTDTVVEAGDADFVLTDTLLNSLLTGSDALSLFEQARLTGGASGNSIDAGDFSGTSTLVGNAGADQLVAAAGGSLLRGGADDDTLLGGAASDRIFGGAGSDSVLGGAGNDSIQGDAGADSISGGQGSDVISGGDGSDSIAGGNGFDTINGGNGADILFGGAGNDLLNGDVGDDSLTGSAGNDDIAGGDGTDTLVESDDTDFTLTDTQLQSAGTGLDALTSIEQAQLTGGTSANVINATAFSGPSTLNGGAGNDTISASAGGSSVTGGDGDDSIFGGAAADTIRGGSGDDNIRGGDGNDLITGGAGDDLINGGQGNDTISGDSGNDRVLGSTNEDYPGDPIQPVDDPDGVDLDSLLGGTGADTIVGGIGSDTVDGQSGADTIDVVSGGSNNGGIDTVINDSIDTVFTDPDDLLI